MNNNQTNIEKVVMRRVRTIAILRPFFSGAALALVVVVLALWGIGREVWVARVFSNGPQDFLGHSEYLFYAFTHTRLLVQALVLVSVSALVYLAQVSVSTASAFVLPRRA